MIVEAGHANHHDQNEPDSPPDGGGLTCWMVRGDGGCPAAENDRADDNPAADNGEREDRMKHRHEWKLVRFGRRVTTRSDRTVVHQRCRVCGKTRTIDADTGRQIYD